MATVASREERTWRARASSRLDHLEKSAKLLASASPSVAAYLGSQHHRLSFSFTHELNNADLLKGKDLRSSLCGRCGNAMIPGRNCEVRSNGVSKKAAKNSSSAATVPKEMRIVYRCKRCEGKTSITTAAKYPQAMKYKRQAVEETKLAAPIAQEPDEQKNAPSLSTQKILRSDDIAPPVETVPANANARSKGRAKARKGGLQAMLQKNKQTGSQSGFGLDLMDFMGPG